MSPTFRLKVLIKILPLLIGLLSLVRLNEVAGQAIITFGETVVENNFPEGMVFEVPVNSTAGDIVRAEFHYAFGGLVSSRYIQTVKADVEPGAETLVSYDWDTSGITIPPSAPINYFWEVTDSAGNKAVSEEMFFRYEDIRFDWHILENEQVGVLWHDRPENFGKRVFAIAETAVAQQRELFQVDLDYQILIVIYNDSEEFNAWQGVPLEWIGGQAFPDFGITTQIVPDQAFQDAWLSDVIPHEISHLYFAQVVDNPIVSVPVWLNEGVSQYNEFGTDKDGLSQVEKAAKSGDLIPLSSLDAGFGRFNEERIRLAYAEARSAINYIVEIYGKDGLARLLAAYNEGLVTDRAMAQVFGRNMGEFESDWASWLGAPKGSLVTPTPWPSPTAPLFPSPMTFVTRDAEAISIEPSPAATEIAQVESAESETQRTTPSPPMTPATESLENPVQDGQSMEPTVEQTDSNQFACLTAPLIILGFAIVFSRRRTGSG